MDDWRKDDDGNAIVVPLNGFGTAAAKGIGVALRLEMGEDDIQLILSSAKARELAIDLLQAAEVADGDPATDGSKH